MTCMHVCTFAVSVNNFVVFITNMINPFLYGSLWCVCKLGSTGRMGMGCWGDYLHATWVLGDGVVLDIQPDYIDLTEGEIVMAPHHVTD